VEKFLCSRYIGTVERILVSYNLTQAQDARDAMVKRVYAELFQLVVDKINFELGATHMARQRFIGVLDIFGFESFMVNSFEQLCINYCNEKLQFHFNEHIFRMEQALYLQEGITIPGTAFVDNQPTLDLLEAKATGVFSMVSLF
jgi:myosin heavy subunit